MIPGKDLNTKGVQSDELSSAGMEIGQYQGICTWRKLRFAHKAALTAKYYRFCNTLFVQRLFSEIICILAPNPFPLAPRTSAVEIFLLMTQRYAGKKTRDEEIFLREDRVLRQDTIFVDV